jgi:hypothetical protein
MDTYFWIEKCDNGDIRFRVYSHDECETEVNRRVQEKKTPPYVTNSFPKYLNDLGAGRVIIICGYALHPKPIQKVMRYEIPLL